MTDEIRARLLARYNGFIGELIAARQVAEDAWSAHRAVGEKASSAQREVEKIEMALEIARKEYEESFQ